MLALYDDDSLYEGFFTGQLDKKDIFGRLIKADGSFYVGEWADGKQHGVGYANDEDGQQRKGRWNEGELVEWLEVEIEMSISLIFETDDEDSSQLEEAQDAA